MTYLGLVFGLAILKNLPSYIMRFSSEYVQYVLSKVNLSEHFGGVERWTHRKSLYDHKIEK